MAAFCRWPLASASESRKRLEGAVNFDGVTKYLQRWLGGYLACCLALAGTVGLSPLLHQLIEHGGRGPLHTHGKARLSVAASHWQVHDQAHAPFTMAGLGRAGEFRGPLAESAVLVAKPGVNSEPAPASNPPASGDAADHEHHGLSQLLLNGLVEFSPDGLTVGVLFPPRLLEAFSPSPLMLAGGFDPQTASRGPPFLELSASISSC